MKTLLTSTLFCFVLNLSFGQNAIKSFNQNEAITYSSQLNATSQSNKKVYDKVLVWFYKSFFHNYDKITTQDRVTGEIVGKTLFFSTYKVPTSADSTLGLHYTDYNFEWSIKIDNGKINFNINNIYINKHIDLTGDKLVTAGEKAPFKILLQNNKEMEKEWSLSKAYLLKNLDNLVASLNTVLKSNDDEQNWSFLETPETPVQQSDLSIR